MFLPRGRLLLVLLLTLAASAARSEPPAEKKPPVRLDRYGDPLPEGAIARLGTVRWRHGLSASMLAYSPDGKILACGGRSVGLCLWDAATGRPLHQLRIPYSVQSLAFWPDGKSILVNSNLRLLDVATGSELRRFKEEKAYYDSVAFSPDGRIIAAGEYGWGGRAAIVSLWDAATGKKLRQLTGHAEEARALAFSPDGLTLASSSKDQTIRLWDVATGKELHQLEGAKDWAQAVAFSRDGMVLASPGMDNLIRLWNVKTGRELRRLKGHEALVYALAFSPDGKRLASGGRDRTIRLWDTDTWKELCRWEAHALVVSSVAFSPDGKTLASTGGVDHAIRLWDAKTGKTINPVVGHTSQVASVMFSADGKTLFSTGGRDNRALEWDVATSTERRRLLGGPPGKAWRVSALSPDGKVLAQWGLAMPGLEPDPIIRLWDAATGKELHVLSKHVGSVWPLAFSPDSKLLASNSNNRLCLWDVATGKEQRELTGHQGEVSSIAFSPDSKILASSGSDRTIRVWDVSTGKQLRRWDSHEDNLHTLVFSPDGRFLAWFDWRGMSVWDVDTGKEMRRFVGHGYAMAFSPCSRILAGTKFETKTMASGDTIEEDTIHLWELVSGQEVHRIAGPPGYTWSLAFAPDGRTLASGGGNSTILLWDLTGRMKDGRLQPTRLTAKELDKHWTDLGGEASKAYRAVWTVAAAPEQAVPLLKGRLRPSPAINRKRIAQLVADLDDKQFTVREKAAEELSRLAELAEPALRKALDSDPSSETRRRVGKLLDALAGPITSGEALRVLRAVEVLEYIGTPEAQAVLQDLAKGTPEARLTQEAKATLERLAKRPAAKP